MSNLEWQVIENEYYIQKTRTNEFGVIETLTEYKQKWRDENPPVELEPQPPSETDIMMDYIVDVDYRVTMIELGL